MRSAEPAGASGLTARLFCFGRSSGGLHTLVLSFLLLLLCGKLSSSAVAAATPPLLISQPTSTRAIALESLCFTSEPFATASPCSWGTDRTTRVMLFAVNLNLQPGETAAAVTADAEDADHQHYALNVEYVAPLPNQPWLTVVVVKLKDELRNAGDVLVRVLYNSAGSNRVRLGIGHLGGGPADDPGAAPTLAPPYTITGQLTNQTGQPLGGLTVNLAGAESGSTVTNSAGNYSFTVNKVGDYAITPVTTPYHSFVARTFTYLHESQTANFSGTLRSYQISGRLTVASVPTSGVVISVSGSQLAQTTTNANGDYSLNLPAGGNFIITPLLTFYEFSPAPLTLNDLTANQSDRNFNGTRQTFSISGRLTGQGGVALGGYGVHAAGVQEGTLTTDANGYYNFSGLLAGYDFTLTPVANPYYTFSSQTFPLLNGNRTADFSGAIRSYTVSGQVHLGPNSGPGVVLQVSGSQTTTVTTDSDGNYAVTLPAGGNYTLTPLLTYYDFSPVNQTVTDLATDQPNRFFLGIRQTYAISGRLVNQEGNSLPGITVNLAGAPEPRVSVTDSAGHYQFSELTAGYDYTVMPVSNSAYVFAAQTFADLRSNQSFDFTGLRRLLLHGTVRDSSGNGLIGVRVRMAGTDNGLAITAADGSYSLIATATGNYTLTPSVGQGWYVFSPSSRQLSNLPASQVIDFSAALAAPPTDAFVLAFDSTPKTVDYGTFWLPGNDLGHFFWEFWAMPGPNAGATYLLSDGYGGAHALLFGVASFNTSEPNRYELLGNLYNGIRVDNYFGSDVGPAIGEWAHFGVGWDGQNIITYYNGVPVGKTPFVGPRLTAGPGGGGGRLLIGGSDHSNFDGRIAQVRGYEASNPHEQTPESAFAPQTIFGLDGNLVSSYLRSGATVADLSRGYNGVNHEGLPRGTLAGILFDCGPCPPPQFVFDPATPNFVTGVPPQPVNLPTPPGPPAEAVVFDSFSRANRTYIFAGLGGLGSTESGSAGPKVWQTNQPPTNPQPFGILNSRAVLLANSTALAWVPQASVNGDADVRVDRYKGRWGSGIHTGLSFRVADESNFFFAYTETEAAGGNKVLRVGYYQAGSRVDLVSDAPIPADWTTLRVVTRTSGAIDVYIDSALVYSTNVPFLAAATGAGLFSDSAGKGLVNRWDSFIVFASPSEQTSTRQVSRPLAFRMSSRLSTTVSRAN